MRHNLGTAIKAHPVIAYVLLTYAISWSLVAPLALNGLGLTHLALPVGWHALGALGPVSAAFIVLAVTRGRSGVGELVASIGRWRVGWGQWTVGIGTPVLMLAAAVAVISVLNRRWPDFGSVFASPSTASFWLVDGVLIGVLYGLGEEPGWRGFALHKLQDRRNALVATLLVFAMWAGFHAPFFTYRFPFGAGNLVGFLMGLLAGAIWLSYLYNVSGGSTLLPMVWHALFNIANAVALASIPGGVAVISVLAIILGIFALVVGGPTKLGAANAECSRGLTTTDARPTQHRIDLREGVRIKIGGDRVGRL